jgi:hypothetical protein
MKLRTMIGLVKASETHFRWLIIMAGYERVNETNRLRYTQRLVRTTCGSGWVEVGRRSSYGNIDPAGTAGGSDRFFP